MIIIHQIFLLMCDWPKSVTWPNIPQPKLGNIREYSPIFKTAHMARKIWRIIKTIVAIWGKNMLGYLSLDIICSSYLTVFLELRSWKTVHFLEQIISVDKYPSIFLCQMTTIVYITFYSNFFGYLIYYDYIFNCKYWWVLQFKIQNVALCIRSIYSVCI